MNGNSSSSRLIERSSAHNSSTSNFIERASTHNRSRKSIERSNSQLSQISSLSERSTNSVRSQHSTNTNNNGRRRGGFFCSRFSWLGILFAVIFVVKFLDTNNLVRQLTPAAVSVTIVRNDGTFLRGNLGEYSTTSNSFFETATSTANTKDVVESDASDEGVDDIDTNITGKEDFVVVTSDNQIEQEVNVSSSSEKQETEKQEEEQQQQQQQNQDVVEEQDTDVVEEQENVVEPTNNESDAEQQPVEETNNVEAAVEEELKEVTESIENINEQQESRIDLEQVGDIAVTDDSNNNNSNEEEQVSTITKPRFVIHMGPLKTGTTTIQTDLTKMVWNSKTLQLDKWNYLNVNNFHPDGTQVSPDLSRIRFEDPNYFDLFKKEVDRLRTFNHNMVYVEEGFSVVYGDHPEYFDKLKEIFGNEWDVTIVVGYRPYFDWIPSTWYQSMRRNEWMYEDPGTWPWKDDEDNYFYIQEMFPEFYSWMSDINQYTDSIVEFASQRGFDVQVMELYNKRGLRDVFFCDVLKAKHCCEESKRLQIEGGGKNEVVNKGSLDTIHFDSINLYAASKGLININNWNRTDVLDAIQKYATDELHKTAKDLPMNCPDEETMNEFFNKSVRLDKICLPAQYADAGNTEREEKLRQSFHKKLVDQKAYCSINKEALLEQDEWQSFFTRFQ